MSVAELRKQTVARLAQAGIASPEAEAGLMLEHLSGRRMFEMELDPAFSFSPGAPEELEAILRRRLRREPLQQILGTAFFRELELFVSPAVLIPRPETEVLLDLLLPETPRGGAFLDLGTGSGAIALSAAYERPDLAVAAVDLSLDALAVAKKNAGKYRLFQVEFLVSDLFSALSGRMFDSIAANLPYVSDAEYAALEPELFFEPRMALTAPEDGFLLLDRAGAELENHLKPGGVALFELSPRQARPFCARWSRPGWTGTVHRDLTGRDRFVSLRREAR